MTPILNDATLRAVQESRLQSLAKIDGRVEALHLARASLNAKIDSMLIYEARRRNDLVPVHRLPVELLVEIFLYVVSEDQGPAVDINFTCSINFVVLHGLAQVSVRWRNIIRTTAGLWNIIHCSKYSAYRDMALRLSGLAPLTILVGDVGDPELVAFLDACRLHIHRWKKLIIRLTDFIDDEEAAPLIPLILNLATEGRSFSHLYVGLWMESRPSMPWPISLALETIHLQGISLSADNVLAAPLPSLLCITIKEVDIISPEILLHLLRCTPNIEYLTLVEIVEKSRPPRLQEVATELKMLKAFNIFHCTVGVTGEVIQGIRAPNLRACCISHFNHDDMAGVQGFVRLLADPNQDTLVHSFARCLANNSRLRVHINDEQVSATLSDGFEDPGSRVLGRHISFTSDWDPYAILDEPLPFWLGLRAPIHLHISENWFDIPPPVIPAVTNWSEFVESINVDCYNHGLVPVEFELHLHLLLPTLASSLSLRRLVFHFTQSGGPPREWERLQPMLKSFIKARQASRSDIRQHLRQLELVYEGVNFATGETMARLIGAEEAGEWVYGTDGGSTTAMEGSSYSMREVDR